MVDPFKRPAEKVAMDVKNEYITAEQAKADYGVLVDPKYLPGTWIDRRTSER